MRYESAHNPTHQNDCPFTLGEWYIEPAKNLISGKGVSKTIEPQPMAVLVYLANKDGTVATQEELLQNIWSDVVVSENVLSRCISILRRTLQDDAKRPEYIETISKSGYRLLMEPQFERSAKNLSIHKPILIGLSALAILAIILLFTTFVPRSGDPVSGPIYSPIPGSLETGTEWDPAVSPDGNYLAFSWKGKAQKNYDIYVKTLGTESIRKLTKGDAWHFDPIWLSDGAHIAYYKRDLKRCGIYKIPVTGGEETKIMSCPEGMSEDFDLSADGKFLIYNGIVNDEKTKSIFIYDIDQNQSQKLSYPSSENLGDYHPKFSPGGNRIVFKRARNKIVQNLFLIDVETKIETRITNKNSTIFGNDWLSEDEVVFASMNTGQYMLWKKNLVSGKISLMPISDQHMINPNYSIESGKLSYMKITDDINLWHQDLNSDSAQAKEWLKTAAIEKHPSISPDGQNVVFVSNRTGEFDLWRAEIDGSNLLKLTESGSKFVGNPNWSPDGSRIVFELYSDQCDVYTISTEGGALTQITFDPADDEIPFFGKNREEIYFSSNRSGSWEIWKSKCGITATQVTVHGGYAAQLDVSQDTLFYVKRDTPGIFKMPLTISGTELIAGEGFNPLYWGNFVLKERYAYVFDPSYMGIVELNIRTEASRLLPNVKGKSPRMSRVITLTPEAKMAIFAKIDVSDTDLMIVDYPATFQ